MKIIKPDNLALLFSPCMPGDSCCISVAAMACFSLDMLLADRLITEADMWQIVSAELGEDEPLDMGHPKPCGEFLVYGAGHAAMPTGGVQARVTVAGLQKSLQVTGQRYWNAAGLPSEPVPFREMRISWANAFGGAGFDLNPVGIGYAPGPDGRVPVPQVQDPRHLLTSPHDRPEPAGFTALNPFWPQRLRHLGSFDDAWVKKRRPHYPHDTRPDYFNTAPPDQRLSGFFRGDEPLTLANMHPSKAEIRSALPGLRARLFIKRIVDGTESFREIETRAETLWLFPGSDCGILLFRGLAQVNDETFDDLTHLMAEWETLPSEPASLEFYHTRLLAAEAPPPTEPVEQPVPAKEPVPPPEPPAVAAPKPPEPPPLPPDAEKKMAELQAVLTKAEAQADAVFAKLGMTRAEALEKYLPKPKAAPAQSVQEAEQMLAGLQQQAEAILKKHGRSLEEIKKSCQPPKAAPQDPHQAIQQLTDALLATEAQFKKTGINLQEAAQGIPGIDPSMLDFGKAVAGLSSLAAAIPPKTGATPPPPPENEAPAVPPADLPQPPAVAPEEPLEVRIQQGKNLAGLNLDGMDFRGRDLSNADFSGSVLTGAHFSGTILKGAIFNGALLADADFSHARMERAKLAGVQAVGARFVSAELSGADLSASDFSGCLFDGANLTGAVVSLSLFADASLTNIRGRGLIALRTSFTKTNLSGSDLCRATVTAADFSRATLDNSCLVEADATQATFDAVQGSGADFSNARMISSRADKDTHFSNALFSGADLSSSCWERARLTGCRMAAANLDHADFSRSVFIRTFMLNATARETNLLKAVMTDCDLRGVNFFKASFRHARLSGCDLKDASMFSTDLHQAKIITSDTRGTDFRRAQTSTAA